MSYKEMIVRYNNFSPTEANIKVNELKVNKSGQGKSARLTYNDNTLYLQTQKLRNPFGLSRGKENTPQHGKKLTCTLSFDQKTVDGKAFLTSMEELQDLIIENAYENRVAWNLGGSPKDSREMTKKEVERKMFKFVKYATDTEGNVTDAYPPTFRVTLNTRNNPETGMVEAIMSEIFDQSNTKLADVGQDTIKANSNARVLMYATSVWVSTAGFGVNWRVHQMKVYPGTGLPVGRCLMDEDEDEDEDEVDAPTEGTSEGTSEGSSETPPEEGKAKLSLRSRA